MRGVLIFFIFTSIVWGTAEVDYAWFTDPSCTVAVPDDSGQDLVGSYTLPSALGSCFEHPDGSGSSIRECIASNELRIAEYVTTDCTGDPTMSANSIVSGACSMFEMTDPLEGTSAQMYAIYTFDDLDCDALSCDIVTHITDNPGYYTCDCVEPDDPCEQTGLCVHTDFCPAKDGLAVLPEEQECYEDPIPSIDVLIHSPVHHNLDNWQEDDDLVANPPYTYYANAGTYEGEQVDMIIQISDTCIPASGDDDGTCHWNPNSGKEDSVFNGDDDNPDQGGFGKLNIQRSSVDLDFKFVRPDGSPVNLEHVYITFLDIDGTQPDQESIVFFDISHLEVTDDTLLERTDFGELATAETYFLKQEDIICDDYGTEIITTSIDDCIDACRLDSVCDEFSVHVDENLDQPGEMRCRIGECNSQSFATPSSLYEIANTFTTKVTNNELSGNVDNPKPEGGLGGIHMLYDHQMQVAAMARWDNTDTAKVRLTSENASNRNFLFAGVSLSFLRRCTTCGDAFGGEDEAYDLSCPGGDNDYLKYPSFYCNNGEADLCQYTDDDGNDASVCLCITKAQLGGTYTLTNGPSTVGDLVIENDGVLLTLTDGDTSFNFGTILEPNDSYDVSIVSEPDNQVCTISDNHDGTAEDADPPADVLDIVIECTRLLFIQGTYTTVVNDASDGNLEIQSTDSEGTMTLSLTGGEDGTFDFGQRVFPGTPYSVEIVSSPDLQHCTIDQATGTDPQSDITDIEIVCEMIYVIQGTYTTDVTDASDGNLEIQSIDSEGTMPLSLTGGTGTFDFGYRAAPGTSYDISIVTVPELQFCSVMENMSGTDVQSDITNVNIVCQMIYGIQGTYTTDVTDASDGNLEIQVTDSEGTMTLSLTGGTGTFDFGYRAAPGTSYDVSIVTFPEFQYCSVMENMSGTDVQSDITDVNIVCQMMHSLGGTYDTIVSPGVSDGNVVIAFGDQELELTGGTGSFDLGPLLSPGDSYQVTIKSGPAFQQCNIFNHEGTNAGEHITDVRIECVMLSISGTYKTDVVEGLSTGDLVLQSTDSAGSTTLSLEGSVVEDAFTFGYRQMLGDSWEVEIVTEPELQYCEMSNASGENSQEDITDVYVECNMLLSVKGTSSTIVSDVSTGVVEIELGGTTLTLNGGDDTFDFGPMFKPGESYEITLVSSPAFQDCTIINRVGTIADAADAVDIEDVRVECVMLSISGNYKTDVVENLSNGDVTISFSGSSGEETLSLTGGEGTFDFGYRQAIGEDWDVSIVTSPDFQYCEISNNVGTNAQEDTTDVYIECNMLLSVGGTTSTVFSPGVSTGQVVIGFGDQELSPTPGADTFDFGPMLQPGDSYEITVVSAPENSVCTIDGADGVVVDSDITDVSIECVLLFFLGGSYTIDFTPGETPDDLVIQFGDTTLTLSDGVGTFDFGPILATGDSFSVEIVSEPDGQMCTMENEEGTATADVLDIVIMCTSDPYKVYGHVLGIREGTTITITENGRSFDFGPGWFVWPVGVGPGYEYDFTITDHPSKYSCNMYNGAGTAPDMDIDDVFVICTPQDCPHKDVSPTIEIDLENTIPTVANLGGMSNSDDSEEILFEGVGTTYNDKRVDLRITVSENCEFCDYHCGTKCDDAHNGGFAKIHIEKSIDLTFSFVYEDGRPATMGLVYMTFMDLDGRHPMTEGIEFMAGIDNLRHSDRTKLRIQDFRDSDGKMTAYTKGWEFNTLNPKRVSDISKSHKRIMVMSKHIGVSEFDIRYVLGEDVTHGRNMLFFGLFDNFMARCETCGDSGVCPGGQISPEADTICYDANTMDECRPNRCRCNKCQPRCAESYTSWYKTCTWWGCGGCDECAALTPEDPNECQSWCPTRAEDVYGWSDACQLEECRGCGECEGVAPCARWCMEQDPDTPWETKCNYENCSGCSQCQPTP